MIGLSFKKIFIYIVLSSLSFSVFGQLCLTPMQIAQIQARAKREKRRNSPEAKLREIKKGIKALGDAIEKLEDHIINEQSELEETLSLGKLGAQVGGEGEDNEGEDNNVLAASDVVEHITEARGKKAWKEECDSRAKENPQDECGVWVVNNLGKQRSGVSVASRFCKDYASKEKNDRGRFFTRLCVKGIEDIEDLNDKIVELREEQAELEDTQEDLEDQIDDNELDKILGRDSDDDETEAGSTDCEICEYHREANKLTTGQKVGNTLSIIAGLGLSYYGVREARKAQSSANDLLALQGFPAENNFGYSLAGASLGVPFINHGILGLSRGNMVAGSYACSGAMQYHGAQFGAQTGHPYNYGVQIPNPYLGGGGAGAGSMFPGGFNPYLGGAGAGFNLNAGFNPYLGGGGAGAGSMFPGGFNPYLGGAGAGFNLNAGFNPYLGGGAGAGSMFPGGFNPYLGGGGAGAGSMFPGGFNPYLGGAGAGFNLNAGFNPYLGGGGAAGAGSMFPGGFNPYLGGGGAGFNPALLQAQQAQAQIQARVQAQTQAQQLYQQQMRAQLEIQMKAREAWLAQQESIQKDWMRKQQVIGDLSQELYRIQNQIQAVALGGGGAGGIGGVNNLGGYNDFGGGASVSIGGGTGSGNVQPGSSPTPGHTSNPAPYDGSGDVTIVPGR